MLDKQKDTVRTYAVTVRKTGLAELAVTQEYAASGGRLRPSRLSRRDGAADRRYTVASPPISAE